MTSETNPTKLPDTLWHYTTAAGLLGILGNVKPQPDNAAAGDATITSSDGFTVSGSEFQAVFRATAIEYLNDHQELIHGLQFLKQAIVDYTENLEAINYGPTDRHEIANPADKAKFFRALCDCIDQIAARDYEHHIHCYTTSFSTKPDVLSQWRGYGGGTSGFAIGVDSSKLPTLPKRRTEGSFFHQQPFLAPVHYGHDKVPTEVTAELTNWLHHWVYSKTQATEPTDGMLNQCVRWMSALAARIKHPGFSEEKEWRYIDLNYYGSHAYRDGGTRLIPYTATLTLPAEAIVEVKVGPGPNQHENYLAAKGALYRFGYVAAAENLTKSETPYR